jgi:hypothetical protein
MTCRRCGEEVENGKSFSISHSEDRYVMFGSATVYDLCEKCYRKAEKRIDNFVNEIWKKQESEEEK